MRNFCTGFNGRTNFAPNGVCSAAMVHPSRKAIASLSVVNSNLIRPPLAVIIWASPPADTVDFPRRSQERIHQTIFRFTRHHFLTNTRQPDTAACCKHYRADIARACSES